MNLKDPSSVLDEISREHAPQPMNLLPGVMDKIQQKRRSSRNSALRMGLAAIVAVVLLVVLFSQPGVASALKKLIGYIPGVGAVEQSAALRVLSTPVLDERDGYSIKVESALLDATQTVINYQIAGQFPTWEDPSLQPEMCRDYPILRLSDGTELRYPTREGSLGNGISQWQDVYSSVPAGVKTATLVLPCLSDLPAGEGPQDWEIPLAFTPAPPELTVYPVVTPLIPPITQAPVSDDEMQLSIQGMAALEEGYFLQSVLSWQSDPSFFEVEVYPDAVHIYDAGGEAVAVWSAGQESPFVPAERGSMNLDLQTGPVMAPGPARLVVDYVGIGMPASAVFSFDVGSSPQPGQTWQINQDLEVNGRQLRVISAEYIETPPGEPVMLMIYLEAGPDIISVIAMDKEHETLGSGGSPNGQEINFRSGWYYKDGFPQGLITVEITWVTIRRSGPWSAIWSPVGGAVQLTPTVQEFVVTEGEAMCQNSRPVELSRDALPAELSGRVTYSLWNGETHDLFVSGLNGSEPVSLGSGVFPELSPDGKQVVYRSMENGLHVRDLESGSDLAIPGTIQETVFDNAFRWSPDGRQIAFERVSGEAFDIYMMNPDGTNLRAVVSGPDNERFLGWMPDSSRIFYWIPGHDDSIIWELDYRTGESFDAGRLPPGIYNARLSPDTSRLLYTTERGIFLAQMDYQVENRLVVGLPHFGNQIYPIWSQNGKWIAAVYWEAAEDTNPVLALIQPDTCQVLLVRDHKAGWLSSWVP